MDQKSGQKRKRRDPYEGRKSTRVKPKFKKQTFYHSSSEDDDEPMPSWRQAPVVKSETITTTDTISDEDDAGVVLPNIISDTSPKDEAAIQPTTNETLSTADIDLKEASNDEGEEEDDDPFLSANQDTLDDSFAQEDISEDDEDTSSKTSDSDADTASASVSTATRALRKRNDPAAFADSISKILGSKLTTSKRSDPVLSRSAAASAKSKELSEDKLEAKARRKMRADKASLMEKGRVRDVLGLEREKPHGQGKPVEKVENGVSTGQIMEKEKQLQRTAQRGVIKLFNAVRAAQMKGFDAENEAKREGKIGMDSRKQKVNEMSKKGFLDLLAEGGS